MHAGLLVRLALVSALTQHSTQSLVLARGSSGTTRTCAFQSACVHGLGLRQPCPVCHAHAYLCRRIRNAVRSGMRRLGARTSYSDTDVLRALGAQSWEHACAHILRKMHCWNSQHKHIPVREMTLVNISIDHIRPVSAFKREDKVPHSLCHHYTNLQPLLMYDDTWKASVWDQRDESVWLARIALKDEFHTIYYSGKRTQPSLLMPHAAPR